MSVSNTKLSGSLSNLVVNTPTTNNYSSLVNNKNNALKKDKNDKINTEKNKSSKRNAYNGKSSLKKKDKERIFNLKNDFGDINQFESNSGRQLNNNFAVFKPIQENNQSNKNKLFTTSTAKNNSDSREIDENYDDNLSGTKEIFLSNKTNFDEAKNKNTDLKRNYIRKRPRNPSKDEVELKKDKDKTKTLIKGRLEEEFDNSDEDEVEGEKSLLDSEETKSFSKKNMKKGSTKEKKKDLLNSSKNKKVNLNLSKEQILKFKLSDK